MDYKKILDHKNGDYHNEVMTESDFILLKQLVSDTGYLEFIENNNGGFFYKNSIHIYSITLTPYFNSFFRVNEVIKKEYINILDNEIFFGQELFGNQFGFSSNGIIFFNIETGERTIIGKTFSDWIDVIDSDIEYYSGINVMEAWVQLNGKLNNEQRLCPKIPFIVGGNYEIENLYSQPFPDYITSNANIANQIYGLPDGTPIRLKIDN
ncbi:MAG TPA: SMI1/KNR4 family protein [Mucilaginibacter sp.]|jgi:hypothetical protein|nr:SMI1/KNR4 family protein [Mucilaginibacter sp.]